MKVRYEDETVELESKITNYDGNPPKVSAYIKGEDLTIAVSDEISGVRYLDVDGIRYTELDAGSIAINLKELERNAEYFTIIAFDNAGNRTNTLRVYNPYYVGDDPVSNTDKGVNNPQSADETKPTSATGIITSHTDENGEDMMDVSYREWKEGNSNGNTTGSKQFFTIKTKSDKTFYIVVDESYNQQTAYLLTEAGENDLLNFVNYDGNSIDSAETTVYTIPKSENKAVTDTAQDEPKEEAKQKKSHPVGLIIICAIAGAGVYFYRQKKNDGEAVDESEYDQELEEKAPEK